MSSPQCLNCVCVSSIPSCMLLSQTQFSFVLAIPSKISIRAPGQLQEGTSILTRLLTVPLWLLREAAQGWVQFPSPQSRNLPPSVPVPGRDTFSTKIRDHKMVLQENLFPSVVLVSGELILTSTFYNVVHQVTKRQIVYNRAMVTQ